MGFFRIIFVERSWTRINPDLDKKTPDLEAWKTACTMKLI